MSKSKNSKAPEPGAAVTKATVKFAANDNSVDPALVSLFASSSGPVKVPARVPRSEKPASTQRQANQQDETSPSGTNSSEDSDSDAGSETSDASSEGEAPSTTSKAKNEAEKPRKRKRTVDADDLEQAYFKRLQREEDKENKQKQAEKKVYNVNTSSDDDETSSATSDSDSSISEPSEVEVPPKHEIFDKKLSDQDRLNRTVFLGNVSTEAIKSKTAKRALTRHLRSVLKTPAHGKRPGKLESIRFRSTAYASGSGPKKATYAKKELMDTTTTSTNAYAVFTTEAAAEHVADKLNGTVILDRHLRVDYLAKSLPIDHKRCVFIGNLSFVNEETQPTNEGDEDGTKKRRPTAKEPADTEEGLWRTFSKVGEVESVRVVRDQETRVSKGFAYVQFRNENSVEGALLMNEKKFPPMLPRKLRVMRARKTRIKPPSALAPRGRSNNDSLVKGKGGKPLVFEGHRATAPGKGNKGKPEGLETRKRERNKKRPNSKSAQRSAQFKRAKARQRKTEGK